MDDTHTVGITQRVGKLCEEPISFSESQWTTLLHFVFECASIKISHDEICDAVTFAIIKHWQNVRMFKSGDNVGFLLKTLTELFTVCQLFRQNFDRHIPVHGRLVCLVDSCHPPLTNLINNSIRAEHLP